MFDKVLIANRGAIAVRIERTLKKMGIGSVAVYSKADQDSLHVERADEAVYIGDGTAKETYLDTKDHKGCTGYRCKSHPSGIRIFE